MKLKHIVVVAIIVIIPVISYAQIRVGYVQSGNYLSYERVFRAILKEMQSKNLIQKTMLLPFEEVNPTILWSFASNSLSSKILKFEESFFYNYDWNNDSKITNEIIRKCNNNEIDILLVFGTIAGQEIVNNRHKTPIFLCSVSDPICAKIVKGITYSGYSNVHTRTDPLRYQRQLRIFYNIFKFKKLGVMVDTDSKNALCYSGFELIKKVAKEKDFEIEVCKVKDDTDRKIAEESCIKCARKLVERNIDACYITANTGVTLDSYPIIAKIFNTAKIPTLDQIADTGVKNGILMSVSWGDYSRLGKFHVNAILKYLEGYELGEINQIMETEISIIVNRTSANILLKQTKELLFKIAGCFYE